MDEYLIVPIDPQKRDETHKQLMDLFNEKLRRVQENYRKAFIQFAIFNGENDFTTESIIRFRDALLSGEIGRHYAPATVALKVKAIKSIIRDVFAENPGITQAQALRLERELKSIKTPHVEVSASRTKTLSRDQIHKLVHECPDKKILPLIKVILLNGCRLNEALKLTRVGMKRSADGMYVHRGIIAKGGKEIHLKITEEILDEIRVQDINTATKCFYWDRKAAGIRIKRAIEKTLGVNASAHTLRHSFATLMLEEGIPLAEVSEWLNHASPRTTAQYYIHGKRSEEGNRFARGLLE